MAQGHAKKISIIGGGVAGLATAHFILRQTARGVEPPQIDLYESAGRVGGVAESVFRDGFLLESGPDSFLSEKPSVIHLAKELGIEHELISTQEKYRKSLVAKNGQLYPLPDGFYLIAPRLLAPFLSSPLFSWPTKLRMACEPLIPPSRSKLDESIASFIVRRFGKAALEEVGQAMIAGIYTGDPERLSLLATMPRLKEMEEKHGSLIRGMRQKTSEQIPAANQAAGPRYSLFLSFAKGMQTLTDALMRQLTEKVSFKLFSSVRDLEWDSATRRWKISLADGQNQWTDVVCLTTNADISSKLLRKLAPKLSGHLGHIGFESVATIQFGYDRPVVGHPLDAFGFVVPANQKSSLIACSFSSQKFAERAPDGKVLLRAFVGGAFGKEFFRMDDQELVERVQSDLQKFLAISGQPLFGLVKRYERSMAQYAVGHLDLVGDIEKEALKFPGLFLTGASYRGVGIPDCVAQAQLCAERICQY